MPLLRRDATQEVGGVSANTKFIIQDWSEAYHMNSIECMPRYVCLQSQFDCSLFPAQQHPETRLRDYNDDNATGNMHSGFIRSQLHLLDASSGTRRQFSREFLNHVKHFVRT
jgi:hypothetical protein